MNRRYFLRLCGKMLAALGFAHLLPVQAAAASGTAIRAPRQIITKDIARSRTILWDAPELPATARVELRRGDVIRSFDAAYEWLALPGGEGLCHYHTTIDALTPNTSYAYRICMDAEQTDWLPLTTGAGDDAPFSALIYADSQCSDFSILQNFLDVTMQRHPSAAFFAIDGDLVDNGELASYWTNFLDVLSPYASRTPFAPVMGNHECYGADWNNTLPKGYCSAFAVPENGSTRFPRYYYSFDCGAAHFIVLNTQFQELDGLRPGLHAEQLVWLKADCRASQKTWKIVLMHKDVLAYDEWQPSTGHDGGISDVGDAFMAAFDALGIDLVLTGHMHTYRNRGHIFAKKPANHGPVYIMSGPAGDQRYHVPPDTMYDRHAMRQDNASDFRNYLVLDVDSRKLAVTCRQENGAIIDRVNLEQSR